MPDSSGRDGVRRTTRKKKKETQDETETKTVGSNEGLLRSTGNSKMPKMKRKRNPKKIMEKTQDSTEFELVHVTSRPAVSKNKVKRNLWDRAIPGASGGVSSVTPPSTKDWTSGRATPGSESGSSPDRPQAMITVMMRGSAQSAESPENAMKKRLRESGKLANGKMREEDTIFQRVKDNQRPALARMRFHKNRKSKERISKGKGKNASFMPIKICHPKKTTSGDEPPTQHEVVHAEAQPAVANKKPRRKEFMGKESHTCKPKPKQHTDELPLFVEAGETIATVEEKNPNVCGLKDPQKNACKPKSPSNQTTVYSEPLSTDSMSPKAKMVSIETGVKRGKQEKPALSNFIEEVDVPELPGYQFEIWKATAKPKFSMTSDSRVISTITPRSVSNPSKENAPVTSTKLGSKARSSSPKSEYYYEKY